MLEWNWGGEINGYIDSRVEWAGTVFSIYWYIYVYLNIENRIKYLNTGGVDIYRLYMYGIY